MIKTVHKHGIGVVGLFVFGFDSDTLETFDAAYDFIRGGRAGRRRARPSSRRIRAPCSARSLLAAGRILPHVTWEEYDTNHVTYQPALMTVEELTAAYDWLCQRIYHPTRIAERGCGRVAAPSGEQDGGALFSSFSTDIGYRREYSHRYR